MKENLGNSRKVRSRRKMIEIARKKKLIVSFDRRFLRILAVVSTRKIRTEHLLKKMSRALANPQGQVDKLALLVNVCTDVVSARRAFIHCIQALSPLQDYEIKVSRLNVREWNKNLMTSTSGCQPSRINVIFYFYTSFMSPSTRRARSGKSRDKDGEIFEYLFI